jgi:hypothetical protein
MRTPRKPSARDTDCADAWYYIDPTHIEVYTQINDKSGVTSCRLSRRQLRQILAIMDGYASKDLRNDY